MFLSFRYEVRNLFNLSTNIDISHTFDMTISPLQVRTLHQFLDIGVNVAVVFKIP